MSSGTETETESKIVDSSSVIIVRAANLWRSWGIRISNLDQDSKDKVWDRVVETLNDAEELKEWLKDPDTKFYHETLGLEKSFTYEQMQTCQKELLFYIIPSTYHLTNYTDEKKKQRQRPLFCHLQIEAEYPSVWFLHKTDIKNHDSYYEQLKIDIQKALTLCQVLKRPTETIPELRNGHYRFMTRSSENAKSRSECQEIAPNMLDLYLRQGNQKWVLRPNGAVESEVTLARKSFTFWNPQPEKKVRIQEPNEDVKQVKGLENAVVEIKPQENLADFSSMNPPQTVGVTNSMADRWRNEFTKFKSAIRQQAPFKWLADRQANEDSATNVALYFALSIIAAIIIAVIVVSAIVITQKNKAKKLAGLPKSGPSPTIGIQTETEAESSKGFPPQDPFYQLDADNDGLSDEELSEEESSDRPEGPAIDRVIGAQNKHFAEAERSEYTRRDLEEDSKLTADYFHRAKAYSTDFEKNLGFPSSSALRKGNCSPGSVCSFPNKKTVTISLN